MINLKTFFANRQRILMVSVLVFAFAIMATTAFATLTFTSTAIDTAAGDAFILGASNTTGSITLGSATHTGSTTISSGNITGTTTTSGAVVSDTALTSGTGLYVLGSGATMTANGIVEDVAMGAATVGTGLKISSTGIMVTTGNLLTLTANSATTAAGLLRINGNGLTSGIGEVITSSATAMTGAGRLLRVDHTGVSGTSAVLSEFASAAADETTILRVTGSGLLAAGVALDVSLAAMTTGTGIDMSDLDAITTGKALHIDATGITQTTGILAHIDSAGTVITGAGRLFLSDHTGISGTSATLNEFKTVAADETILLALTAEALTTGVVLDFGATAALTTGEALKIAHTTSAIADGGSLLRLSSSSIDTGGATNGTLLDIGSTAQLAGVLVKVLSIATTGTVADITSTGIMTTNGEVLNVVANSATTSTGLVRISGTGLTTGSGLEITAAVATLTTGSYIRANDGVSDVFAVKTNGHIAIVQGTEPAIGVTGGVTSGTVSAGNATGNGADTRGQLSIVQAANAAAGTATVTFHKAFAVAPVCTMTPASATAAVNNALVWVSSSTTILTVNYPTGVTNGTDLWNYVCIE